MADSSTSSLPKSFKYDVFLSFRGEDTRKNFIDHLYSALQQQNISTYKDDERIEKGKRIKDELMGSIQDSKYFIIVFSKNYASSSWCLDELLKIMECQKTTEHTVYPVFFDVEPSEVRNQTGAVGEAFARYEREKAAGEWRKALKEAADLAGWELKNTADGHEAKFIQQVVEKLSLELRAINVHINKNLVGMATRINDIISSLGTASDDVHMIGIWGIGGGGKTTLARAIFNKISFQFEGKSFIENVREVSKASLSGLNSLQSEIPIYGRKVLLVLDDVDHVDQLEALAGDPSLFKPGSIIIITTRDEQVLVAHGVKLIHNVNLLSDKEAIRLFSRYAFGTEIPIQGYEELSRQVVCYAAGLPLTIKVLGSFLCGKSELEWADALARLKTIPLEETQKKLELSYIGLEDDHKEIFLDVATILKGWKKSLAVEALESCGFYAIIGLRVLEQKALITFYDDDDDKRVGMHDQIQEMGRNIVRRSHPDMPNKHSRLWDDKEIKDILADDSGTEATKCIYLFTIRLDLEPFMNGLRKMQELRSLDVNDFSVYRYQQTDEFSPHFQTILGFLCCNWNFNEVRPYFPESLRYLHWLHYPFKYLPKTFHANNLVGLLMVRSNMVQLWEGGERKVLHKLRFLTLDGGHLSAFDLRLTPNLETLLLKGNGKLVKLYMTVECLKLRYLTLEGVKLRTFDLGLTPNLEEFFLKDSDLEELRMADECVKLKSLYLNGLKQKTLDLGLSPNLEKLCVVRCDLKEFHIAECPLLTEIVITGSKFRTLDLRLVPNLSVLILSICKGLVELHLPSRCLNLKELRVTDSKLRTIHIGLAPILTHLQFKNCYDLEELHLDNQCQKLVYLYSSYSKLRTLDLGLTPNLEKLHLIRCYNLVELHASIGCLKNLVDLDLSGCLVFKSFSFQIKDNTFGIVNKSLEVRPLAELYFTLKVCPFHPDNHLYKFESECFYKEDLPSLTTSIEKLLSARLCACTELERFSRTICSLQDAEDFDEDSEIESGSEMSC